MPRQQRATNKVAPQSGPTASQSQDPKVKDEAEKETPALPTAPKRKRRRSRSASPETRRIEQRRRMEESRQMEESHQRGLTRRVIAASCVTVAVSAIVLSLEQQFEDDEISENEYEECLEILAGGVRSFSNALRGES